MNKTAASIHRLPTCHDVGACLQRLDCPCTGRCDQDRLRLAPGVIDGPYLRRRSRAERIARDLLLACGLIAAMVVVVHLVLLAHTAGWL